MGEFVRAVFVLCILLLASMPVQAIPAAQIMDSTDQNQSLLSLNGSGVIIAIADTGIDMDHTCFRDTVNETGIAGNNHRKIVHLNNSIDDWDNTGHQQFRHGTHLAGILACDPLDGNDELRSLSHEARLVVQDIVNSDGWNPPLAAELLEEAAFHGAVINSWSWGDNTIEYTNRSREIDQWLVENPWSLVFIAPGNNGNTVLEPANALNAVSVSASDAEVNGSVWQSSSHGPDVNGRRGVFVTAPGINVVSALSDGHNDSMNNGTYSMGGTSVATPMAASFSALLQEYVEREYGFTPSGALLRSMLAMSAEPINSAVPDAMQGYGRPSLDTLGNGVYLHDSYRVENWSDIVAERGWGLDSLISNPWNGSGAVGPFLQENDSWEKYLRPVSGQDVEVVLSYNARPDNYESDDLRLIVSTPDGKFALDDNFSSTGYSTVYTDYFSSPYSHNSTNETTVMVRLPSEFCDQYEWLKVEVFAKSVYNGSFNGGVGLDGDRLGFAISATGLVDFMPNSAPEINIISAPLSSGNYSHEITIDFGIYDNEGDGGVVAIRLVNENFSANLGDCASYFEVSKNISCNVNFSIELMTFPINREDWRFEIVVVDDNNSVWTSTFSNAFLSDNFTIWWASPLMENEQEEYTREGDSKTAQNRALIWGVVGVIFGAIVAASVMFMRFEKEVFDDVKSPFVDED